MDEKERGAMKEKWRWKKCRIVKNVQALHCKETLPRTKTRSQRVTLECIHILGPHYTRHDGHIQCTAAQIHAITYRYVNCFMLPIEVLMVPERKLFLASL